METKVFFQLKIIIVILVSSIRFIWIHLVASELKDPIWHSLEWQIGSFSSEATICYGSMTIIICNFSAWTVFRRLKSKNDSRAESVNFSSLI